MTTRKPLPRDPEVPNLSPLLSAWEWQQHGNCVGENSETFFLPEGSRMAAKQRRETEAKLFCLACPVREQCLAHALSVPEDYGVWGGMTADERRTLIIKRKRFRNG